MRLGHRLLLIVGHTLGDFALPLMQTQCKRAGTTLEEMTPEEADLILPVVERVLSGFVLRPKDLAATMHELRLEVGAERFADATRAREIAGARAEGSS